MFYLLNTSMAPSQNSHRIPPPSKNSFRLCLYFDSEHSRLSGLICFYTGALECSFSLNDTSLWSLSRNLSLRWRGTDWLGSSPVRYALLYSAQLRTRSAQADCTDKCCSILHWLSLSYFLSILQRACTRLRMPRISLTKLRERLFKACTSPACRPRLLAWCRDGWGQGASNSSLRTNCLALNRLWDSFLYTMSAYWCSRTSMVEWEWMSKIGNMLDRKMSSRLLNLLKYSSNLSGKRVSQE
jgi:hypothetical protein